METFVVRVWRPSPDVGEGDRGDLRGRVEHVASGEWVIFRGGTELAAIIHEKLGGGPQPGPPPVAPD